MLHLPTEYKAVAKAASAKGFGLPAKTSNTKVILNGGQKVTFARPDGYFSPVRVDISARNPGHIQAALTENRRVLNELVLEPLKAEQYYEVREPFNIASLLKSTMGLMVGFMVLMVFVMPKMMENIVCQSAPHNLYRLIQ
ncbi:ER membrane protein complex subunit 7 homolog [Lolium perenne]|uniref:ER membrane protein complex subunit 7 homolog n=1 Tax=Lolium perenne TaxID=4522 RepID=UPI003A98D871